MNQKSSIKVLLTEKNLYRIVIDLKKWGRSEFSYPNQPKIQRGLARTIGVRYKKLIDERFLNPTTITHNRYPSLNTLTLPVPKPDFPYEIKITEIKRKWGSRFDFEKIKLY